MHASGNAPGSLASLRSSNEQRVLAALIDEDGLSQADVARVTGLSTASISGIVRRLAAEGRVDIVEHTGRSNLVRIADAVGVCVAVNFSHRHVQLVVGGLSGTALFERKVVHLVDADGAGSLRLAESMITDAFDELGIDRSAVIGAVVGIPGPVDIDDGMVGHESIMPGWVALHPAQWLSELLDCPAALENDANLGAIGEFSTGAGRGYRNGVYVKLATGIGAGFIFGGELYRGEWGMAGELGHTSIDPSGPLCRCGNRGCLQTIAGSRVLLDQIAASHGEEATLDDLVAGALRGEAAYRRAIEDAGTAIGSALAIVCNLINPGAIVLGGQLVTAGDILLAPLEAALRRRVMPRTARDLVVVRAGHGADSAMRGALRLARERFGVLAA